MQPDDLAHHITSLSVAADVVDAIDDPSLQATRGWNLTGWSYEFVPWGIRFLYRDINGAVTGGIVASALPEVFRERITASLAHTTSRSIVLMLG